MSSAGEESPDIPPNKEHPASDLVAAQSIHHDLELQVTGNATNGFHATKVSDFKSLGLLDRFLAVWILLAMAVGIILGNFVPNTGPALQKGKLVGVSVPIGKRARTLLSPEEIPR